tara:strand:+ start:3579 stop:4097 length:519 start_codon:yes stop_codon:yes gene_type:complete
MKLKIVLIALCFTGFFANGQTKVGTINSEFIVGLMPETKQVLTRLNDYAVRLDSSYQVKLADYQGKVAAFQKLDPSLSANFKKIKVDEITEMEESLQQNQQNGNKLIQLKRDELMRPLYKILRETIAEIAKAESYTQIITSSGNELAYVDETYDITQKVMAKLGIKMPPVKK